MSLEKHEKKPYSHMLVKMANDISRFFATQSGQPPEQGTAGHIKKFWDPRMRNAIIAHLDQGGAGLEPVARKAVEELKKVQAA
jgi:formate dehydrogenase subunit delta